MAKKQNKILPDNDGRMSYEEFLIAVRKALDPDIDWFKMQHLLLTQLDVLIELINKNEQSINCLWALHAVLYGLCDKNPQDILVQMSDDDISKLRTGIELAGSRAQLSDIEKLKKLIATTENSNPVPSSAEGLRKGPKLASLYLTEVVAKKLSWSGAVEQLNLWADAIDNFVCPKPSVENWMSLEDLSTKLGFDTIDQFYLWKSGLKKSYPEIDGEDWFVNLGNQGKRFNPKHFDELKRLYDETYGKNSEKKKSTKAKTGVKKAGQKDKVKSAVAVKPVIKADENHWTLEQLAEKLELKNGQSVSKLKYQILKDNPALKDTVNSWFVNSAGTKSVSLKLFKAEHFEEFKALVENFKKKSSKTKASSTKAKATKAELPDVRVVDDPEPARMVLPVGALPIGHPKNAQELRIVQKTLEVWIQELEAAKKEHEIAEQKYGEKFEQAAKPGEDTVKVLAELQLANEQVLAAAARVKEVQTNLMKACEEKEQATQEALRVAQQEERKAAKALKEVRALKAKYAKEFGDEK